jgi:hypothetical protein
MPAGVGTAKLSTRPSDTHTTSGTIFAPGHEGEAGGAAAAAVQLTGEIWAALATAERFVTTRDCLVDSLQAGGDAVDAVDAVKNQKGRKGPCRHDRHSLWEQTDSRRMPARHDAGETFSWSSAHVTWCRRVGCSRPFSEQSAPAMTHPTYLCHITLLDDDRDAIGRALYLWVAAEGDTLC